MIVKFIQCSQTLLSLESVEFEVEELVSADSLELVGEVLSGLSLLIN